MAVVVAAAVEVEGQEAVVVVVVVVVVVAAAAARALASFDAVLSVNARAETHDRDGTSAFRHCSGPSTLTCWLFCSSGRLRIAYKPFSPT